LDLAVGFSGMAPIGSQVGKERPLAVIHASSETRAESAATMLRNACSIADSPPPERAVIYEKLSGCA